MKLNLTKGVTETEQYKAFKFPGGEIHFKLTHPFASELAYSEPHSFLDVDCRLNSSDDIMLLAIALDTIAKDYDNLVRVFIPYMPYQQADRDFSEGESFSLITMVKMLDVMPFHSVAIFDPHSDVTPALLSMNGSVSVIDNQEYIKSAIASLTSFKNNDAYEEDEHHWNAHRDLVILAPDAGAYKKIFKLTEAIGFKGRVEVANKYRNTEDGTIQVRLSVDDFEGKDVLIIDDICVGGRTFVELAKLLVQRNTGNLHLAVSHGIFSNGFEDLEHYFQNIYTTNSIKDDYPCENVNVYEII